MESSVMVTGSHPSVQHNPDGMHRVPSAPGSRAFGFWGLISASDPRHVHGVIAALHGRQAFLQALR
jgi:hypothetical protein